jgi:hypothetical protein
MPQTTDALAICGPGGRIQTQIVLDGPNTHTVSRCVYGRATMIPGPKIRTRFGWRRAGPREVALMLRSQRRRTPQSNDLARVNRARIDGVAAYSIGSTAIARRFRPYDVGRARAIRVVDALSRR